jgi:pyruvate formate lyase activating enzyme
MDAAATSEGYIFNVQRFTVHDGPGIRTEVFFKGCPLRCKWCSNPESIDVHPQVGVYASRCIGVDKCAYCLPVCPVADAGVFVLNETRGVAALNRDLCTDCLACADPCPANALMVWGRKVSLDDLMRVILADVEFYEKSGGGVTLSGGDPLVQWRFARAVLEECKRCGIHTCLETELHVRPAILDAVYPFVDLVITDIKHMDPAKHRELTGVGNARILQNIRKTVDWGMPLVVRVPVVPDHNNGVENIAATAEFVARELGNRVLKVQLLPYRQLGVEKYESLGIPYPMRDFQPPERKVWEENILSLVALMQSYGVPAVAGSGQKL